MNTTIETTTTTRNPILGWDGRLLWLRRDAVLRWSRCVGCGASCPPRSSAVPTCDACEQRGYAADLLGVFIGGWLARAILSDRRPRVVAMDAKSMTIEIMLPDVVECAFAAALEGTRS
jgi:hypothetical protein